MTEPRYWIGVVSQEPRRHRRRRRLHAGEPRQGRPARAHARGRRLRLLFAAHRLPGRRPAAGVHRHRPHSRPASVYQADAGADFHPFRLDVDYFPATPAPIRPLLESLTFIRSKTHWGAAFRFGSCAFRPRISRASPRRWAATSPPISASPRARVDARGRRPAARRRAERCAIVARHAALPDDRPRAPLPLQWQWSRLPELPALDLYAALAARQTVFAVEQHCAFQDADGLDLHAWHLLGWAARARRSASSPCYLRVIDPGRKFAEPVDRPGADHARLSRHRTGSRGDDRGPRPRRARVSRPRRSASPRSSGSRRSTRASAFAPSPPRSRKTASRTSRCSGPDACPCVARVERQRNPGPWQCNHPGFAGAQPGLRLDARRAVLACAMMVLPDLARRVPTRAAHETDLPRFRAADRRSAGQDRRAALRPRGLGGGHLRRDQPPAEEEPAAHQGDLRQALGVADRAGRPAPAAALHARLPRRDVQRFPRAARRPLVRRRPRDRRRPRALQRPALRGDRPAEGARHQGEDPPQLRHAAPGGLPQGAAPHEARREIRAAAVHVHRHARRLPRHRRRGARPVRGHRPQPLRNGRAARADHRHGDRRGRLRRRARHRGRRRHADAAVRHLLGDLAGGLRVDPVEIGGARAGGRRNAGHHGDAPEAARPHRQGRHRAAGRRAPRPRGDDDRRCARC